MAISTFDTLKFVRRLEAAGVPAEQAEVQAEVLTEAFNVNLDALVTKDFLAARFAEQNASIDTRFAEQNASIESRFAEQNAKIDANHRIFVWTQAIIMAAVILPYLERMLLLG
ncbi:MAG: hypothetical protein O2971_12350 [Proteobacteria bacterium]|nr:hypothetical protein [Pseudomonadota bacterium]